MGSLFSTPSVPAPPPPKPTPPMPDMQSPQVQEASRMQAASILGRDGRRSTILSQGNGGGAYTQKTLSGTE